MAHFKESKATSEFLLIFDQLFNVFNSKNQFGKSSKAAMNATTEDLWRTLFAKSRNYIASLKTSDGKNVTSAKCKTGFIGFLMAISSFEELYKKFVETDRLQYFLTFKWSQDHLETFFATVQASLRCNNNPTVRQFQRIMKKLLIHNEICGGRGQNCDDSDVPSVLTVSSVPPKDAASEMDQIDDDFDFNTLDFLEHSEFKDSVLFYISGYVVKMVQKKLNCNICAEALTEDINQRAKNHQALLRRKKFGKLIKASDDVLFVCSITEHVIEKTVANTFSESKFMHGLLSTILKICVTRRP